MRHLESSPSANGAKWHKLHHELVALKLHLELVALKLHLALMALKLHLALMALKLHIALMALKLHLALMALKLQLEFKEFCIIYVYILYMYKISFELNNCWHIIPPGLP